MKAYDNEIENITGKTQTSKYNKLSHKRIFNISIKYIIIFIIFFICLTFLSYLLAEYKKLLYKCKADLNNALNNKFINNENRLIKNEFNSLSFNEPILPDNDKDIPVKKYFKTNYNISNIRYHFEDIFYNRKIFKINYSYTPYEKIDKSKSYDTNADYIYQKTGMLNITKLDNYYYDQFDLDFSNFNHIHLSMGHDANYILLSLVTIASVLNTTSIDTFIHFHFVLTNCTFEDMKPIIELKKIYKNVEFIFYDGKQAEFDFSIYAKTYKRGVGDYARFLIPEIVNNTNKIIILDSADVIVKKDLSEIYFFDLDGYYFGFSLDIFSGKDLKLYPFQRNKFYPNTGICLVNVVLFRKDQLYMNGYFSRLAYDDVPCPYQDMFFMISRYKFKYFPLIYNYPQLFPDEKQYNDKIYNNPLLNFYLKVQNNSIFKYTLDEIVEAESNHVINHLYSTKPFKKLANKKTGKIWVEYTKLANVYDKLRLKYPEAFKYYES